MNIPNVRKIGYEHSIWERSGFYLQNLSKTYKTIKKCDVSKKVHFVNGAPVIKIILEYAVHPIDTIKVRFGRSLDFTSKC